MEKRPLDYAKASMDTMMRKWEAPKLPPEGRFHYHQGVFLSGMYKSYELCKEEKYFDYIKSWVDAVITEDGVIKQADMGQSTICSRVFCYIPSIIVPVMPDIRKPWTL